MIEGVDIEFMENPCNEIINDYHSRFPEIGHKPPEYAVRIEERYEIKSPDHCNNECCRKKSIPDNGMRLLKSVSSELSPYPAANSAEKILSDPKRA